MGQCSKCNSYYIVVYKDQNSLSGKFHKFSVFASLSIGSECGPVLHNVQ